MKKLFVSCAALVLIFVTGNTFINAQQKLAAFKDDNGLWGYINSKGEVVIPARYSVVKEFSLDGFALVREKTSKQHYYIDASGSILELNCKPERYGNFSDGMAMVKIGEFWGYINTEGKLSIEAKYSKAADFMQGKAIVQTLAGKVFLLDKSGNEKDLSDLMITNFKEFSEGLIQVQVAYGNWGFIDAEGNMVIEAKYLRTGNFSGGLAWVRVGEGQDGYINTSGQVVIDPNYLSVKNFDPVSGIARVKNQSENWIFINKEGVELQVDAKKLDDFSEGLCGIDKISDPGIFGFIDKDGKWVIEPKFDGIGNFQNGVCRVRVKKQWGVIDKEGNFVIEPKYIGLHDFAQIE